MPKIKMRCISCGKWFQSANAKEVTCPDCAQKARKEKLAAKNAPPQTTARATGPVQPTRQVAPAPKPKAAQSGTNQWLDKLDDVRVGQPEQPPVRPKLTPPVTKEQRGGPGPGGYRSPTGPGGYREDRGPGGYREGGNRGPGGYRDDYRGVGNYRVGSSSGYAPPVGPRPRQPMEGGPGRGPRPDKGGRPAGPRDGQQTGYGGPRGKPKGKPQRPKSDAPPKPKKEKIPPPQPFVPTAEQIQQVEARYVELATPTEFDGIRTQIAKELKIPKKAVKNIIKDLRSRQSIPSWWEIQTYKGSSEELEKIKATYEPLLPVPPVGVHKKIAEELELKPGVVYQAIKAIRLEMNLPQYNEPSSHGPDFVASQQAKQQKKTEGTPATKTEEIAQPAESQAAATSVENAVAEA